PNDHRYPRTAARRYGAIFSKPGNGICHQVHLESFSVPGQTLLGTDSHTPLCGAAGMLAIGAGGLDVAVAMGGGPYSFTMPAVVRVWLTGELGPWVTAKDVILEMLRRFSVRGGVGKIFEYAGPGVAALSLPQRMTIANMGAELGLTTSVFPSDAVTRDYFRRLHRRRAWTPRAADARGHRSRAGGRNEEPPRLQPQLPGPERREGRRGLPVLVGHRGRLGADGHDHRSADGGRAGRPLPARELRHLERGTRHAGRQRRSHSRTEYQISSAG